MLFFVFVYLGMAALGMSLESMITVLTPRYVPFFLFTLVRPSLCPARTFMHMNYRSYTMLLLSFFPWSFRIPSTHTVRAFLYGTYDPHIRPLTSHLLRHSGIC